MINETQMLEIADKTKLVYDGGDDNRLFYDGDRIDVYAPAIGYNKYRTMEKELRNFEIKREKYTVYAWNDISGWNYWKQEGECNYIQITACLNNSNLNDIEIQQLIEDIDTAHCEFYHYHTIDAYCDYLNKREA